MNKKYIIKEFRIDLDENHEIELPSETKILNVYYATKNLDDVVTVIGGKDRLLIFYKMRYSLLHGDSKDDLYKIASKYNMTEIMNSLLHHNLMMIIEALVPI